MGAPRIVTFPSDDSNFTKSVQQAFASLDGEARDGRLTSAQKVIELVSQLLPEYPAVQIHQQAELASFERDPNTWYVYRDGHPG